MMPVMMIIGNLGFVAVAVLGGWLAIQGQVRIGDIQAFIQYLNQFTQPITQTANIANVMQSTAAAAERVFEFLDEPEESPDVATAGAARQRAGRGRVRPRRLRLRPREDHHQGFLGPRRAGTAGGHRRSDRRGQDDDGQPADALLRSRPGGDPDRWRADARDDPRRRAPALRHGAAGQLALHRNDRGEHRLRQPGRDARGGPRRRRGGARRPLHPRPARAATRWS